MKPKGLKKQNSSLFFKILILIEISTFILSIFIKDNSIVNANINNAIFSYSNTNNKIISLNGEWQFYEGLINPDIKTGRIEANSNTKYISIPATKKNGLFTFVVDINNLPVDNDYSLYIPIIPLVSQVFINGKLIKAKGHISSNPEEITYSNNSYCINLSQFKQSIQLIIQTASFINFKQGIPIAPYIGTSDKIYSKRTIPLFIWIIISVISLSMTIYSFFFYASMQRDKNIIAPFLPLFFGFSITLFFVFGGNYLQKTFSFLDFSFNSLFRIKKILSLLLSFFLFLQIYRLLTKKIKKILPCFLGFLFICILLWCFLPIKALYIMNFINKYLVVIIVMILLVSLFINIYFIKKKSKTIFWGCFCFLLNIYGSSFIVETPFAWNELITGFYPYSSSILANHYIPTLVCFLEIGIIVIFTFYIANPTSMNLDTMTIIVENKVKSDNKITFENCTNYFQLSKRELQVLELVLKGLDNTMIANQLCISLPTVKTHISKIFKATQTHNRHELFNLFSSNK